MLCYRVAPSLDQLPMMELDRTENDLRDILIKPLLEPKEGYLKVPDKPGLGIEVDQEALEKYRIYI